MLIPLWSSADKHPKAPQKRKIPPKMRPFHLPKIDTSRMHYPPPTYWELILYSALYKLLSSSTSSTRHSVATSIRSDMRLLCTW